MKSLRHDDNYYMEISTIILLVSVNFNFISFFCVKNMMFWCAKSCATCGHVCRPRYEVITNHIVFSLLLYLSLLLGGHLTPRY